MVKPTTPKLDEAVLAEGGVSVTQLDSASGAIVIVELCRERALNAVTPATFRALHSVLDTLDTSAPATNNTSTTTTPTRLLLLGRGRAFCAGGDVRAIRAAAKLAGPAGSAERRAVARATLKTEYHFLERFAAVGAGAKVVTIGVAHGVAFGAGNGLLQACGVRAVSHRAALAMPEARIGLVPDCGATNFLARLPGAVGMYAALTGARVAAADAVALGLADVLVPPGWPLGDGGDADTDADAKGDAVVQAVEAFAQSGYTTTGIAPGSGADALADESSALRRWIDATFGGGGGGGDSVASLDDILSAVAASAVQEEEDERSGAVTDGRHWAREAHGLIQGASPTALRETWKAMREGYKDSGGSGDGDGGEKLGAAVARELAANEVLGAAWDFEEGVRAALVDKDGKPRWGRSPPPPTEEPEK